MSFILNNHAQDLDPILDEYIRWCIRITNYVFYPDEGKTPPIMPTSFEAWLVNIRKEHPEKLDILKAVDKIYADLQTESASLISTAQSSKEKPEEGQFEKFSMFLEEFANHCRRLEKDFTREGFELDPVTGFRAGDAFIHDIDIEIERLKRSGSEFCVAIARIGLFEEIKNGAGQAVADTIMQTLAHLVEKNIRSFDDAYKIDENLLIVTLKQTELLGALNAMERIQRSMDEKNVTYPGDQERRRIVISSSVMQPTVVDEAEKILKTLKEDLKNIESDDGRISRHKEESPIDKYIRVSE